MIEEKIEHGGEAAPVAVKKKKPTNVVELASVLQQTRAKTKSEKVANKIRATRRKKAA
jgi:hypothetical protein